eukprot:3959174-Amphidinium_carterae.1
MKGLSLERLWVCAQWCKRDGVPGDYGDHATKLGVLVEAAFKCVTVELQHHTVTRSMCFCTISSSCN